MLGRALKMTFWVLYDHLGKVILANILATVIVAPPLTLFAFVVAFADGLPWLLLGLPASLALTMVVPVALVGLAQLAKELIETHDGAIATMFSGVRLYGLRAAGFGLLLWLAVACLGTSAWFYATRLEATAPWLGYMIAAMAVWGLGFVALTACLGLPALVQKKTGVMATVKLASMLVLNKPWFALGVLVQVMAVSVLLLIPPVAALIYLATVAVLLTSAYEMLARDYALRILGISGARDEQTLGHVVLVSRNGRWEIDESQDDFLNRGLRDALFPWKE